MARPKNDGKGRIGGRGKGTPNKVTSTTRRMLAKFIQSNSKNLQAHFDELEDPKDKLMIFEKLLKYVIPPQTITTVDISELSDADIDNVVNSLLNDIKKNDN